MNETLRSGFVAIVGRPNAGKSTLLNRVLGTQVSIVTPKAQTTRERVLGILTDEERGQVVFIDTPGIHRAREGGINAFMVEEAREALEAPTLVWYLVDPSSKPEYEAPVLDLLEKSGAPTVVLLNKMDVVRKPDFEANVEALEQGLLKAFAERKIPIERVMRLSGRQGEGVGELMELTWAKLPEGPLYYPDPEMISDRPMRFFAAEKIREQLLMKLGQELPYSCAVEIAKYEDPEQEGGLTRIEAVIHVERDSQKGMVIGKGGQKIKEIGQAARESIEKFTGGKVFLGLKVDVIKDWSRDPKALKRLGYNVPEPKRAG